MSIKGSRPTGREDPGHRDSWSKSWKRPEIILTAVLGLAGLVIAAWSLAAELQPQTDPVAQCREHHPDANGKPVRTEEGQPHYVIKGCGQPGIPGVAEDGLWKVDLSIYHIPDAPLTEIFTQAELFVTECPVLGLSYHFSKQLITDNDFIVIQLGQVVSGHSGQPATIYDAGELVGREELHPLPDRLIVLNNGRNQLQTVSCEPLSALPPAAG